MDKEQYDKLILDAKTKFELEQRKIKHGYAMSNNPYKVGDIIKDHEETIKIKKISWRSWSSLNNYPECVYIGPVLKKNLEPRKDGRESNIAQSYIIKEEVIK